MEQTMRPAWATVMKVAVALLAGIVMFVVLVPTSGAGPFCYSLLAIRVPCEGELAFAAGAVTAGVIGLALWLNQKVAVALLAGLVVFVLLFHWGGGQDSAPPTCFGMFGWYTVPCEGWVAPAAGAVTAALVGLALWLKDRRRVT